MVSIFIQQNDSMIIVMLLQSDSSFDIQNCQIGASVLPLILCTG